MKIAVSQCLAGEACRYDGGSKPNAAVLELVRQGEAVCICPECLGGLPTPREPSEIIGGEGADVLAGRAKVLNRAGQDVSERFIQGAYAALAICKAQGIGYAILKARSPSCGTGKIYDGSFSGALRGGDGVTAALLKQNGIQVVTESLRPYGGQRGEKAEVL
ncbi:MAG: DUF523 domain-containing protein [Christensenellaceae bacterium]|jgi:uncharacterized protein YbbK (DUF523 family)|nr:DUF523 domain-containing protein [Christensenellaceae bacterium]